MRAETAMKILVFNCGSSSLKFQLIEIAAGGVQRKLARGIVDQIGAQGHYRFSAGAAPPVEGRESLAGHEEAVERVVAWLKSDPGLADCDAVGHRVVHGGQKFTAPVAINEAVLADIEALCDIAPLHNPAALSGIRATRKVLGPAMPMAAAFDTAFHHDLPE